MERVNGAVRVFSYIVIFNHYVVIQQSQTQRLKIYYGPPLRIAYMPLRLGAVSYLVIKLKENHTIWLC